MWPLVLCFFFFSFSAYWKNIFHSLYMIQHLPIFHFFLWPNDIPVYGFTTFCLFFHPLLGFRPFDYYSKCCWEHSCARFGRHVSVLRYVFRSGIAGLYGNSMFSFWGTDKLPKKLHNFMFQPSMDEGSGSTSLPVFFIVCFFSHVGGVRWHLTVVWHFFND